MGSRHYDLIVIGTGPAGQKGAIQAARLGKRVAIIERSPVVGGVAVNTGTIPSKALREAALHLTGAHKRKLYGQSVRVKRRITLGDLLAMANSVIRAEWDCIHDSFEREGIDLVWGAARFEGPNLLQVIRAQESELITADKFLVAVGTRPARPSDVPFDNTTVFTSDELLKLEDLPRSMIVVGGGVIGTEYACILATLGVRVTLIEGRDHVLGFLDQEISEALQYHMRQGGITLRMGERVEKIEHLEGADGQKHVRATLASGKKIQAHTLLYSVGRQGVRKELGLDNVGLAYDDRERLKVDGNYCTAVPHIYAAGDVVGFPALASTAMEQGRLAVCHMYGVSAQSMEQLFPFGIYAVPEISMVGKTEQQLTKEGVPYESGIAHYRDIARGQILGDRTGMLKLLIHQETRKILGVHILGTGATELVHIGQAVMALGGTVEFFIHNVFNYPTLAEGYRLAAQDGLNRLEHLQTLSVASPVSAPNEPHAQAA